MRLSLVFLSLCWMISGPALGNQNGASGEEEWEDVDRLALAGVLLRDGFPARAEKQLRELDPQDTELDTVRYYSLLGLSVQRQDRPEDAYSLYVRAHEAAAAPPTVREDGTVVERSPLHGSTTLLMAQCAFQTEDYSNALRALDLAEGTVEFSPQVHLLGVHSHWKLGNREGGWEALETALSEHPGHTELLQTAIFFLTENDLNQAAAELAGVLRNSVSGAEMETRKAVWIAIGQAFRLSGALEEAALLLEDARASGVEGIEILQLLGSVYEEQERFYLAGILYERGSATYPELTGRAAECFRKAGKWSRALFLNARVTDQKEKFRQRLGILLDLERFEEVSKMEPRLRRLGLLDEDSMRYALGYAAFQSGDFSNAEKWIAPIRDETTYQSVIRLREAMASCKEEGWLCN